MINSIAIFVTVLLSIRVVSELVVRFFIRRRFIWQNNGGKSWAVITGVGASNGIGFEWARQLALKGYNLLMIGLVEEELAQAKVMIAREVKLQTKHDISIQTIQVDFAATDDEMYKRIEAFLDLQKRDIFVLVNNAGTNAGLPDHFLSGDYVKRNQTLLNVNIVPMTRLIEIILPSMLKKERGLIINMASGSCFMPVSLLTSYAATKSYVWKLSECLAAEYRDSNINIVAFGPLVVSTNMTNNPQLGNFVLSAKEYVEKAMASIRYHEFSWSHPCWGHWVHNIALQSIGWLFTPVALERFHIWLIPRLKLTSDVGKHLNWWQQIKFLFFDDHKNCL